MRPTASDLLIRRIERQSRRLWVGLGVIVGLVLVALVVLIILVLQADHRLEDTIQAIKEQAADNHHQVDRQLQALQDQHSQQDRYTLCLAELFSNQKPDAVCVPPFPGAGGSNAPAVGKAQSQSTSSTIHPATSQTKATPAASSQGSQPPQPKPQPRPTPQQTIQRVISNLTGGLL